MTTEKAYAKLNLTLEVGEKRPDGYHEVISVMTSADLCDGVEVEKSEGIALSCDRPDLPTDGRNLAVKAAQVFFETTGIAGGCRITLKKRIPDEAGLGGGSSDAAAVLRALRKLYAPDMPTAELESMGAQVGSDVPYCVRGGTVLCRGRGEMMTDLPDMPKCWYVIVKPEEAFSTGKMYAEIDARQPETVSATARLTAELERKNLPGIAANMTNTFERIISEESRVWEIKHRLRQCGAPGAVMSGSGSAVFGIFAAEKEAEIAAQAMREGYPQTFLCKSV